MVYTLILTHTLTQFLDWEALPTWSKSFVASIETTSSPTTPGPDGPPEGSRLKVVLKGMTFTPVVEVSCALQTIHSSQYTHLLHRKTPRKNSAGVVIYPSPVSLPVDIPLCLNKALRTHRARLWSTQKLSKVVLHG